MRSPWRGCVYWEKLQAVRTTMHMRFGEVYTASDTTDLFGAEDSHLWLCDFCHASMVAYQNRAQRPGPRARM